MPPFCPTSINKCASWFVSVGDGMYFKSFSQILKYLCSGLYLLLTISAISLLCFLPPVLPLSAPHHFPTVGMPHPYSLWKSLSSTGAWPQTRGPWPVLPHLPGSCLSAPGRPETQCQLIHVCPAWQQPGLHTEARAQVERGQSRLCLWIPGWPWAGPCPLWASAILN